MKKRYERVDLLPSNPHIESAVVNADGPGIGKIGIFSLINAVISSAPGSQIPGVPIEKEIKINQDMTRITKEEE